MNINKKYIGILSVAATILLSACSSDDSGAQNNTTDNIPVGVKMQNYILHQHRQMECIL